MVKVCISYFYRLRFFDPSMIPLSTAVWDPKWFTKAGKPYYDKNGVINGYKIQPLVPGEGCNTLCHGSEGCNSSPDTCDFLKKYREQLDAIDYDQFMLTLQTMVDKLKPILQLDKELSVILMVYEPPSKPCSERVPLKAWFEDHGYNLEEV